jgi:hypothetical protein
MTTNPRDATNCLGSQVITRHSGRALVVPRAGPDSRIAVVAPPKHAMRAVTPAPTTDVDLLAAMLFAVGQQVRRPARRQRMDAAPIVGRRRRADSRTAPQELFRRLAVCVGGCTIETIQALCGRAGASAVEALVSQSAARA